MMDGEDALVFVAAAAEDTVVIVVVEMRIGIGVRDPEWQVQSSGMERSAVTVAVAADVVMVVVAVAGNDYFAYEEAVIVAVVAD